MASQISINGTVSRGSDVRQQNVMAVSAIANIVKSSLGPVGLDKMLVDEVGDVTITNDGATILKQLEVEHPAGKILVELSNLQDQEVGDGTTSVVILAAELLKQGHELVRMGMHPTAIISGYRLAQKESLNFIKNNISCKVETLGKDCIVNCAKTCLSSKIIGSGDTDHFARLAAEAVIAVKSTDSAGKPKHQIKAITILKAHGGGSHDSQLINGYALNNTRASQAMPVLVKNAKILLLDIDLRRHKLPMGVSVLVTDPSKLAAIRQREEDITKERIQLMLKAGANVILTTGGIDDNSLKYFVEAGVIAVRRVAKTDLRHIAKCTGAELLVNLSDSEGVEMIDPSCLGEAGLVEEVRVGDGELLYIRDCKNSAAQTIVLRGANDYMLDEIDRSLHDALCVIKRVLESNTVVPGGGCVETAISIHLEHLAETMSSKEQLAVAAFSRALLVIPKTLAINGALDATELVSKLRAYHNASQLDPKKADYRFTGLDLDNGKVRNNLRAGVLEPAISKVKSIRFATEAAITILRIDDSIVMSKKNDPKNPVQDDY